MKVRTMVRHAGIVITVVAVITSVVTEAQNPGLKLTMVRPAELKFVAMSNGTFQAAVVGDATKPGPYAVRTRLPADLRIQPHSHPEERIVLIMSGRLYVGFGDRFDETKMTLLPPGSVFTEPSNQRHYTWAKDGEVFLHVTGNGPTATTWVDGKKKKQE